MTFARALEQAAPPQVLTLDPRAPLINVKAPLPSGLWMESGLPAFLGSKDIMENQTSAF